MNKNSSQKEYAATILKRLKDRYGVVKCGLIYDSVWQLLVATILSVQTTDIRVNKITPLLFSKYPTVYDIDSLDINELKEIIKSSGFYNQKAKFIKGAANIIVNEFNGEVPKTINELMKLPGVARKIANVVLNCGFHINSGIAVDAHVKRISKLLGLTTSNNQDKVEKDLMNLFNEEDYDQVSLLFIQLGREVCIANKPQCKLCPLKDICSSSLAKNNTKAG